MDYLPPGYVERIGDKRFPRFVIKDVEGRFWAGEGRWSNKPAKALLFNREIDAAKQKNRFCLGGEKADTFVATIVITVHPKCWSRKALVAFLKRHREFCIGGPADKGGLLLEIVPDTLRKSKP